MSSFNSLKAVIDASIKTNDNQEITGAILNSVLNQMVDSLGADYQFAGVAIPSTNPGSPDQNVFYLASEVGSYSYFGLSIPTNGVYAFVWNGSWALQRIILIYNDLETGVVAEDGLFFVDKYLNVGVKIDSDGLNASNMLTIQPV